MTIDPQQLMLFYIANQAASALVQALPAPNGNVVYQFFYKFVNLLTADFKTFSAQMPMPQFQYTLSAPQVPGSTSATETITSNVTKTVADPVALANMVAGTNATIISSAL
jgi:hypothetical protein